MEFVKGSTYADIKRMVGVTDGPVMPHPQSTSGKRIRVTHASATFTLRDDEWALQSSYHVRIGGPVLKKDGTDGKETWGGAVHSTWRGRPEYVWLVRLIDAIRPEGVPALPFKLTGIENDDREGGS